MQVNTPGITLPIITEDSFMHNMCKESVQLLLHKEYQDSMMFMSRNKNVWNYKSMIDFITCNMWPELKYYCGKHYNHYDSFKVRKDMTIERIRLVRNQYMYVRSWDASFTIDEWLVERFTFLIIRASLMFKQDYDKHGQKYGKRRYNWDKLVKETKRLNVRLNLHKRTIWEELLILPKLLSITSRYPEPTEIDRKVLQSV